SPDLILFLICPYIFFSRHLHHLALHSFPTRRSSDLFVAQSNPEPQAGMVVFGDTHQAVAVAHPVPALGLAFGQYGDGDTGDGGTDRKSTRLNSSHVAISYAVFCLKKKKNEYHHIRVF